MNIITLDTETFSPDLIQDINFRTSIVICSLENNVNFLLQNNDRLYLLNNKNDIIFNNLKMIENSVCILEYNPHIRWCVPKGVDVVFKEPHKIKSFYKNIYTNHLEIDSDPIQHDILNINFCIHLDKDRCKEKQKIYNGERLFEIDINYGPFTEEAVEEIYLLQNNYIFQEFKKHFDR